MKKIFIKSRAAVLVFLTHRVALPFLKKIRKPNVFDHDMEELKDLPIGSLGNDLYVFLKKRNLPLLPHYARHDLKHVLLDYDTTDQGEVCLQSFMLGNGRISFPVIATVVFGIITMPECWRKMWQSFAKGKHCSSFHGWNWNDLVTAQTFDLRKRIFNN